MYLLRISLSSKRIQIPQPSLKSNLQIKGCKILRICLPYTLPKHTIASLVPKSPEHSITLPTHWEDSSSNEESHQNLNQPPPDQTHEPPSPPPSSTSPPPLRRSHRNHQPPKWLVDYHTNSSISIISPTPIVNLTFTIVSPTFTSFMSAIKHYHDPICFKNVILHPHWIVSMNEELAASEENNTWVVTDLPLGK